MKKKKMMMMMTMIIIIIIMESSQEPISKLPNELHCIIQPNVHYLNII